MDSPSDSKPYECSFKSEKMLSSSSSQNLSQSDEIPKTVSDTSPWSSQTPEKPADHRRRVRNPRAAFSFKEMREEEAKLQVSGQDRMRCPDLVGSTKQHTGSESGAKMTARLKKEVDWSVKLPEKYEMLGNFFDSLDSSIRLLQLRGSMSTFTNISPKVECLTNRRFSYVHMAQLKFILPEVIEMKKVLVHDQRTSCMKPDLHISMNVDAIKYEGKLKSMNRNSHMRKGEVPEETLPEPFNKLKLDRHTSIEAILEQKPASAAHLSHTFRKHFSQQISCPATENTNQIKDTVSPQPLVLPISELHVDPSSNEGRISAFTAPSSTKFSLKPPTYEKFSSHGASEAGVSPFHPHMSPLKPRDCLEDGASSAGIVIIQGTPVKIVSTAVNLMSATPALRPRKRCYMSPDDSSTTSGSKLIRRRPLINRSLKFDSPVKNVVVEHKVNDTGVPVDNDIFDILPENLLQSIREKDLKALEEKDPAISQAKRKQKMIAGLLKLIDMICFLFQSFNRSVVTKEELMHLLVANQLDILDRGEVEEQVQLLEELFPEWISEKLAFGGDILICINKMCSLDTMRARIVEAE